MQDFLDVDKLDLLEKKIRMLGLLAKEKQKKLVVTTKADGTIVTNIDLTISKTVISLIREYFPECNIISEEDITEIKDDAPFTFVLDPIDGTDVYSQGLPCFCIALGILDRNHQPVGAQIYAPRFGIEAEDLFLRLDPGSPDVMANGRVFYERGSNDYPTQITMSSSAFKQIRLATFTGKVRIFGSSIIHLLSPVVYPYIQGCVASSSYIWDVAASHAILKHFGMDIEYLDGGLLEYDDYFINRHQFPGIAVAGSPETRAYLRKQVTMLK